VRGSIGGAALVIAAGLVRAASAAAAAEDGRTPALELTALAGVAQPSCSPGTCDGSFGAGASIAGGVAIRATRRWAFGLAGAAARAGWHAPFIASDGTTQTISSTVTTGLVGVNARLTALPDLALSPVLDMTAGVGFQTETRTGSSCYDGERPGTSLGAGVRFRLPPVALLALGVASLSIPLQGCALSDGGPATAPTTLTLGVLLGMTVDLALRGGGAS
jgi:hypothetical protein